MTDKPNRRPPKQFEPPPWERDQFEDFARRRDEAREESELAEALAALATAESQQEDVREQESSRPVEAELQPSEPTSEPAADDAAVLDEKVMAAMLLQLRAEEPAQDETVHRVSIAFSAFSAVIGLVLLVWGFAALLRTRSAMAGIVGGSILLAFGAMFVGIGVWMAVRSLKERGVL